MHACEELCILLRDLHYPVSVVVLGHVIKELMVTVMVMAIMECFDTTSKSNKVTFT